MKNCVMIDWTQRVLAFDTSFLIFHQYYSATKHLPTCSFSDVSKDNVDPELEKKRMLREFGDKFYSTVDEKSKAYGVEMTNVCFLMDCPRSEIWRKRVLKSYKESRVKSTSFDPNAFNYAREVVIPMFAQLGSSVCGYESAEADDMAAGLARAAHTNNAKDVVIITGDSDFSQLVTSPVRVHDLARQCLLDKQGLHDPQVALLRKILSGDKSDNIPAIKPRLGPKTAAQLSGDPEALQELLKSSVVNAAYMRNRSLIDLNASPAELREAIDAVFTNI